MRRIFFVMLATLGILFVLSVIFFYPLGRFIGGVLSSGKEGAVIAAYPASLQTVAGKRASGYVEYSNIPLCLQQSIISVEDKRFYTHSGVDPFAAVRVFFQSFRNDHEDHGGSTITQQLARAILRIPRIQPTAIDSLKSELAVMQGALILEHEYTKDQILELYLNSVYFGRGATGAGDAAQAYFGKPLSDLDLGQCLYLAGMPQAPTVFGQDPAGWYAHNRYEHVLSTMARNGYITQTQVAELKKESLFSE